MRDKSFKVSARLNCNRYAAIFIVVPTHEFDPWLLRHAEGASEVRLVMLFGKVCLTCYITSMLPRVMAYVVMAYAVMAYAAMTYVVVALLCN